MRRALRALTHGVYVLSTHHDGVDDFLIVSLVMQASVEPPRIALAVSVNARILAALQLSRKGVLGVLPKGAVAAVRRYGAPGGVRHAPGDATRSTGHIAMPPEASFWIEISVHSEHACGDHILFIADATGATVAAIESNERDGLSAPFVPYTLADSGFPYGG